LYLTITNQIFRFQVDVSVANANIISDPLAFLPLPPATHTAKIRLTPKGKPRFILQL